MFHSVQLNVNNPHFLIMQGRINKVGTTGATQTHAVCVVVVGAPKATTQSVIYTDKHGPI